MVQKKEEAIENRCQCLSPREVDDIGYEDQRKKLRKDEKFSSQLPLISRLNRCLKAAAEPWEGGDSPRQVETLVMCGTRKRENMSQ